LSRCTASASSDRGAGLEQGAVDHQFANLGGHLWLAQGAPPVIHGLGEMIEEMLDTSRAPGQVEQQGGPHDAPSQPRTPANGLVGVRNTDDPLRNEMYHFPPERGLKSIRNMARDFFAQSDGLLAQGLVERITRAIVSSDVFDPPTISTSGIRWGGLNGCAITQRSGCWLTPGLDIAHGEPRGTGGNDDVRWQ
jgi:hypothetical protein